MVCERIEDSVDVRVLRAPGPALPHEGVCRTGRAGVLTGGTNRDGAGLPGKRDGETAKRCIELDLVRPLAIEVGYGQGEVKKREVPGAKERVVDERRQRVGGIERNDSEERLRCGRAARAVDVQELRETRLPGAVGGPADP